MTAMLMLFAPHILRDLIKHSFIGDQRRSSSAILVNLLAFRYLNDLGQWILLPRIERTLHTKRRAVGELEGSCANFKIDKLAVATSHCHGLLPLGICNSLGICLHVKIEAFLKSSQ